MNATRIQLAWPESVRVTMVMLRRKVASSFSLCRAAFCGALVLSGLSRGYSQAPGSLHPTLEGRVMVGYQGWFRAVGDGSDEHWWHYRVEANKDVPLAANRFDMEYLNIEYWPDVSELLNLRNKDGREVTYPVDAFRLSDGSIPRVFSSHDPETVQMHFRWMQENSIPGAFVQRFVSSVIPAGNRARVATDKVLIAALAAARETGRSVAVMYDLSGMPAGAMDQVFNDWRHLVDVLRVTESPAYQFHRGKPVVAVWGVGFKENQSERSYTLEETGTLLDNLKGAARSPLTGAFYPGNTVVAGVSYHWFEQPQGEDATLSVMLRSILRKVDVICPWSPGRYKDMGEARWLVEKRANREKRDGEYLGEIPWCKDKGIDYMPVVFPGYSHRNQYKGLGKDGSRDPAEREDGRFLWEQYRRLADGGCTMFFQAMFDEIDEGTQIFKVINNPPEVTSPNKLLSYDPLPTDYYLRLVGRANAELTTMLSNKTSFAPRIPNLGYDPALQATIDRRLQSQELARYTFAESSYQANKRWDKIAEWALPYAPRPLLDATGSPLPVTAMHPSTPRAWTPPDNFGRRLSMFGKWNWGLTNSTDPDAFVTWEFLPSAPGRYKLSIRHPYDRFSQNATRAILVVTEGWESTPIKTQIHYPIDLRTRDETKPWTQMEWKQIGDAIEVQGGLPLRLTLMHPMKVDSSSILTERDITKPLALDYSGRLMMFEPRLEAVGATVPASPTPSGMMRASDTPPSRPNIPPPATATPTNVRVIISP